MPDPEASHSTMKTVLNAGNYSTGACVRACCMVVNVRSDSGDHLNHSFRRSLVRGSAMAPKSLMKRR
jgi:hypothetical protein